MTPFEIQDALDSMVIIVDTREQVSDRAEKRYKQFSAPCERKKLEYGDYSAEFILNNEQYRIKAAIERKMSLEELSACFTRDRERFQREMERAKQDNASLYFLIENATWEKIINGGYKTRFNSKAFLASLTAWIARYDLKPIFCHSEVSGILINEILYRELKERLERGDYG